MRVLVTGSTGFVGSRLVPFLASRGHHITRLVRSAPRTGDVHWDPARGVLREADLTDFEAVVHLAGENLSSGRWTTARKERIRDSRLQGTHLLARTLAKLPEPPAVLVCASAVGYYGNRGQEILTEESTPGSDFLAAVCRDWEKAADPAREAGVRVVHLRTGVVLGAQGGALAKMLPPFRMGLGGRLGSGQQYMSWITIDDLIQITELAITNKDLHGPVNTVTPTPVTNLEFTKTLARVLGRPTLFPVPVFAMRLLFGEMADAVLLSSTRVAPTQLVSLGYQFHHPDLETALRHLLART